MQDHDLFMDNGKHDLEVALGLWGSLNKMVKSAGIDDHGTSPVELAWKAVVECVDRLEGLCLKDGKTYLQKLLDDAATLDANGKKALLRDMEKVFKTTTPDLENITKACHAVLESNPLVHQETLESNCDSLIAAVKSFLLVASFCTEATREVLPDFTDKCDVFIANYETKLSVFAEAFLPDKGSLSDALDKYRQALGLCAGVCMCVCACVICILVFVFLL
jgi:hypothetical protein